ncbi:MAG TPA: carboxylesterase family protein, partial [Kofleriaceae bacterium]|nr:carboxylesterase family protein [Kofleriaceae bacterium]
MFSTCARLLLLGVLASCASLDEVDLGSDDSADGATIDSPRVLDDHAALAITEEGLIRGIATDATLVFRGIPYARPPVGDLRWKPPERAARHRGILDATQFANHCPQPAGSFGQASVTEDCLFLNVWAPNPFHHRDFGLRPVMVWIHGGALVTGESDDYDATRLVDQGDVIVVTINYRLGALGFLAHPALTAESPDHASGNYGLLDQQEALRWIRRNILLFGGNPNKVTIFGESAGGLSVHSQLASPTSAGLFQRAIVQSGAYQLTQSSLAANETAGSAFATAAGCTDQTAACLRGLSVAQIVAAQPGGTNGPRPTIDGVFLTQSVGAAFASGEFNRVPVMEGANHDEWRLFVG